VRALPTFASKANIVEEHFADREIRSVEWDEHAVDDNF
jgi:hypothetical protein